MVASGLAASTRRKIVRGAFLGEFLAIVIICSELPWSVAVLERDTAGVKA